MFFTSLTPIYSAGNFKSLENAKIKQVAIYFMTF